MRPALLPRALPQPQLVARRVSDAKLRSLCAGLAGRSAGSLSVEEAALLAEGERRGLVLVVVHLTDEVPSPPPPPLPDEGALAVARRRGSQVHRLIG